MKDALVEYLICPKCGQNFTLKIKKKIKKEIIEGYLICLKRHKFPISGGIPRLVVDKTMNFVKLKIRFL